MKMKMTTAVFFSDLEANFDNIIPAFTNILCQKKGMSKNACKMIELVLWRTSFIIMYAQQWALPKHHMRMMKTCPKCLEKDKEKEIAWPIGP